MIKFTELRVQKDRLIITAEVRELEYYDNVYIDKIIIDTQDTYRTSGPSANAIYSETIDGNVKTVSLDLDTDDLNSVDMQRTMFFVYAVAKGSPDPATPCGFDDETTIGVTFSLCPIYNEAMRYMKEIEHTCDLPKAFIDIILRFKAIQYSIDAGHLVQAIKYYNMFYKNLGAHTSRGCGCHG